MSIANIGPLIALSILTAGCSVVREYPRCYLFREPLQSDIDAANATTAEVLRRVVGTSRFALGKDSVAVKATPAQQKRVSSIWPPFGCVNLRRSDPYTGEIIDKWIVARCQDFLGEVLAREPRKLPEPRTTIPQKYDDFTCH